MSKLNGSKKERLSNQQHVAGAPGYRGALTLDVEKYLEYLKEFSLSDEAKNEVVRTLWDMVQELVDIAWGDTSVQTAMVSLLPTAIQWTKRRMSRGLRRKVVSRTVRVAARRQGLLADYDTRRTSNRTMSLQVIENNQNLSGRIAVENFLRTPLDNSRTENLFLFFNLLTNDADQASSKWRARGEKLRTLSSKH